MESDMRRSGIDVIGRRSRGGRISANSMPPARTWSRRWCRIFKAGLEANEFCMWVTSAPLQADQAGKRPAQRRSRVCIPIFTNGQIEILDYSQWYTPPAGSTPIRFCKVGPINSPRPARTV